MNFEGWLMALIFVLIVGLLILAGVDSHEHKIVCLEAMKINPNVQCFK